MTEKFSSPEPEKNIIIANPRALFMVFTGMRKQKIEQMGYTIEEKTETIVEGVSFYWAVRVIKDDKELVLKGRVDNRFNAGSEPMEINIEKNNFSKEELESLSKIPLSSL